MTNGKHMKLSRSRIRNLILIIICACYMFFIFMFSQEITESIIITATNTAIKVLPTLFVFMVITSFMSNSGTISVLEQSIGRIFSYILGIKSCAATAVFIGLISGFPVGASTVCNLYKTGMLDKKDAEQALFLSHNPSPSFTIVSVGMVMWGSNCIGMILFVSQILSMLIVSGIVFKRSRVQSQHIMSIYHSKSISDSLTEAITTSVYSTVKIVGFIVFWRTLSDILALLLKHCNSFIVQIIPCVLEIFSGSMEASKLGDLAGIGLCGFTIGFGGISALSQATSFTYSAGLSIKKVYLLKLLQGVFCALITLLIYQIKFM